MIEPRTIEYYDWREDIKPVLLANLNELLVKDGIEPLDNFHGGTFLGGKWVGVLDSNDYRNFWHVYIELWGDDLSNDAYQVEYFPHPDNDSEWDYMYKIADDFCKKERSGYDHTDPHWARHLVTAMRKLLSEHITPDDEDGYRLVFWWSW